MRILFNDKQLKFYRNMDKLARDEFSLLIHLQIFSSFVLVQSGQSPNSVYMKVYSDGLKIQSFNQTLNERWLKIYSKENEYFVIRISDCALSSIFPYFSSN